MQAQQPALPRLLWDAWTAYSHRASGYQGAVLLTVVYYLILGPTAMLARLFGKPLMDLSDRPRPSYWLERQPLDTSLRGLKRQF